ncbi:hypothetical protein RHSIM_Rhsim10G0132000 [Rhododendron simsii]|uniref:Transcription factor CBF/NF-Y/archaeal histone domain-containing protein n=1 Tax=Rhododendron simsii TaxID=118357 RepID=A0A834GFV9_RHOSS|nr:hypothetical protein RHSIM_Rhsim10G0132000 [Rhododendron simsii]
MILRQREMEDERPKSGPNGANRANVGRIMKKVIPGNGKISKDAKETVQECVSEFISFVTGEASDKCQREKRKTINGEDIIWAITLLGRWSEERRRGNSDQTSRYVVEVDDVATAACSSSLGFGSAIMDEVGANSSNFADGAAQNDSLTVNNLESSIGLFNHKGFVTHCKFFGEAF